MVRMLLLFGALLLGLSMVNSGSFTGWDIFPLNDERMMWAALLPAVYIFGLFLLRD